MEASPVLKVSRKNNWRANHPLRGRQRVASFSCSKSEYRPCFRGVKGASRESHERGCRSHRAASETVLFVGGEWVGVVALRYNGRPKTVGTWLITWWTFLMFFHSPLCLFFIFIGAGGNEIERPKSREQIHSPDFGMACRLWHGSWPTTPPPRW